MAFEWDPEKNEFNIVKHGIDFQDAVEVFDKAYFGRVTRSVQKLGEISYVFGDPSDANVDGYEYNLAGGLTKMIYPSGRAVSYTHDGAGRVSGASSTMGSETKTYVGSVSYHPHGATNVMTLGNAAVETRLYNNRLQPTTVKLEKDAATLLSITNGYGTTSNNGNVLSQTIARSVGSVMHNFGYDGLNRLQTATQPGVWSQNYSYDRYGNRTASGILPSPTLTPASFSSTTNRITDSGYGFDPAGNLTPTPGGRTLAYDAENRQTSLTDSGTTFTYHYDGEGRRVKKVTNLGATVYVYDAFGELAAEYADHAPVGQPECTTCYLTADHLGSTRVVTDGAGAVVEETDYYPFGEEINGGDWFNPKFTAKLRDYESGLNLDYFGARYYAGAMGRFTSADPLMGSAHLIDPQSWNRYSYAANNPARFNDPGGLWNWDATAGGAFTDAELEQRKRDKSISKRERKEAKRALRFRAKFRAARSAAETAANASGDASAQQSVAAWGSENDGNNVSVGWMNSKRSSARVQLLKDSDNVLASFNLGLTGNAFAATVAHEGRHVGDANNWLLYHFTAGALNMNHYYRELRAWQVSGIVAQALGMRRYAPKGGGPEYEVWNRSWKVPDIQTNRNAGVSNILKKLYFASPSDTNTYSSEHGHRP